MDTVRAVEVIVRVMSPPIGPTMARSATEAHCQKLVHATFILAYGLIAGGTRRQLELLRS
jgi:hypothetical protein